jgi:nucleotide-binding universal stress UspA family protein
MHDGPVLFAFDGSSHARAAIERAGKLWRPGPAVVATAWTSFEGAAPAALLALPGKVVHDAVEDLDAAGRETAEALAAEGADLARTAGFEAEPRAVRSDRSFFAALLEAADEVDAAAIAMGSRGRSPIAATVLGSVSTGVLHHTHRPVLVVRDDEGNAPALAVRADE